MLNPTQIIEQIQNDAPCVYNILHEETSEDATPDKLLEALTEYDWDNHDVHYWSWRYAQMIETANAIDSMIAVFEENGKKLAPMMDYEYKIKIDLLKNLQENII